MILQFPQVRRPMLLVTGAGTLGREVVKLMREDMPVRVLSHGEDAMWRCEELNPAVVAYKHPVEYVIGDIRDREAVAKAMRGVTHVISTAAMKHVKYGSQNPTELIKTNVVGLSNLLEESLAEKVQCFVQISTDKVVNAENIYGTSKKMGEDMVAATGQPGYCSMRFGNFLGSRGSVIQRWREQLIETGGYDNGDDPYIKLTDPKMNRFFIKPREVAEFICTHMSPCVPAGQVIAPIMKVFNMGTVAELFSQLHGGARIIEIGAGPGEKRDEHIISYREASRTTVQPDCYIIHTHEVEDAITFPLGTDVLPKQTAAETMAYMGEAMR